MKHYQFKRFLINIKSSYNQLKNKKDFDDDINKKLVKGVTSILMNLHPTIRFKLLNKIIFNVKSESNFEIKELEQKLEQYKLSISEIQL